MPDALISIELDTGETVLLGEFNIILDASWNIRPDIEPVWTNDRGKTVTVIGVLMSDIDVSHRFRSINQAMLPRQTGYFHVHLTPELNGGGRTPTLAKVRKDYLDGRIETDEFLTAVDVVFSASRKEVKG